MLKNSEREEKKSKTDSKIVIQSDRGVHYKSGKYQELTKDMKRSYSRKGNPWDNACIESYHSLIKREWLNRYRIKDYTQAYKLVLNI